MFCFVLLCCDIWYQGRKRIQDSPLLQMRKRCREQRRRAVAGFVIVGYRLLFVKPKRFFCRPMPHPDSFRFFLWEDFEYALSFMSPGIGKVVVFLKKARFGSLVKAASGL